MAVDMGGRQREQQREKGWPLALKPGPPHETNLRELKQNRKGKKKKKKNVPGYDRRRNQGASYVNCRHGFWSVPLIVRESKHGRFVFLFCLYPPSPTCASGNGRIGPSSSRQAF